MPTAPANPPATHEAPLAATRRILLIRPSALGDVCRTVPALVTLRQAYPEAHIDWLVHDACADAVRHHPALSGVVDFPRRRLGALWRSPAALVEAVRWGRNLHRAGYDLVVDLQGLFRSGLFTGLTRAAQRLGYANAREGAWLFYNHRHRVDVRRHTVERMLGLLAAAGYTISRDMRLYVSDADRQWAGDLVREPYVALAPTARWACKCWPLDRYVAVARQLLVRGDLGDRVVVLAAPSEVDQVKPLVKALGNAAISPRTTVGRMMALVACCRLLVCNDSGPLHVAVGFDRPLVTIFGPTDPDLVGPYGRSDTVVRPPAPGMGALSPRSYRQHRDDQSLISQVRTDAVLAKIEKQLAGGTRATSSPR